MELADATVKEIQDLSPQERSVLAEVLYEEQLEAAPDFTGYTEEDLRRRGLTDRMLAVKARIHADFLRLLGEMEEVAVRDARRRFRGMGEEGRRRAAIADIERDFARLRRRPYFPLMRFGKYVVRVTDEKGKIQEFEMHDQSLDADNSYRDWEKRLEHSGRFRRGWSVRRDMLTDQQFSFQGLPAGFSDALQANLNLTPDQQRELKEILHKMAPEQSLRKHFLKRKKTAGFSEDMLRTYANYFWHGSNHIARVRHAADLQEAINDVKKQKDLVPGQATDVSALSGIQGYLEKHLDYILNPKNEMAGLRGFGFMWYLGFVPKSALVNLSQVPLVTLPYLGARYGDVAATKALSAAIKAVPKYVKRDSLPPRTVEMLEHLTKMGLINQSFATELAALSGGTALNAALADTGLGRKSREILGKGTWLFSMAEQANRRITAVAAYELHRDKILDGRRETDLTEAERVDLESRATDAAREAVERTQFEYSGWNRAPFMRGKASVIFLFMSYVQNMLFFLGRRDAATARYLGMVLFFAGLQGLPFAEDLMDLIDRMFSTPNRRFNVRKETREFLTDLGLNPDLMMLGISSESFGLSYLGRAAGIPIPEVDIQGSLSFGRPLGFTEGLAPPGPVDTDREFMQLAEGVGGAVAAIPMNWFRAMHSDSPNTLKRVEMAMPSFARNITRAVRYAAEGEESTMSGAFLAEIPRSSVSDVGGLMLQAFGFAPSDVNRARRARWASKEVEIYYKARKTELLGRLNWAHTKDRRMIKAALDDITAYNREVPYHELRIKQTSIQTSRKRFMVKRRRERAGQPTEEIIRGIHTDVGGAFTPRSFGEGPGQ